MAAAAALRAIEGGGGGDRPAGLAPHQCAADERGKIPKRDRHGRGLPGNRRRSRRGGEGREAAPPRQAEIEVRNDVFPAAIRFQTARRLARGSETVP